MMTLIGTWLMILEKPGPYPAVTSQKYLWRIKKGLLVVLHLQMSYGGTAVYQSSPVLLE